MNICVPVTEDQGLESPMSAHFGSSALFVIVDTETTACRALPNRTHGHGACQPLASLAGEAVDGVVVGGIGMGALAKLQAANIRVYQAQVTTVREVLTAFKGGRLQDFSPATVCGHHGQGPHGSCGGGGHDAP